MTSSQFRGTFHLGRVSSVDKGRHSVQVQFEELDGFVSFDLQMLVTRPGDYSLPAVDSMVWCVIKEGRLGEGFVLGAIYTDNDAAPLDDAGKRSIVSDDLRLGAADADKKVALAPTCKQNFDDIKSEFNTIKATLGSITGGISTTASFSAPYTVVGYSPTDPAASKVKAK